MASSLNSQPLHTVYGGAHLFRADTAQKLGLLAVRSLLENTSDCFEFGEAVGLPEVREFPGSKNGRMSLLRRFMKFGEKAKHVHPAGFLAYSMYERVLHKLRTEPVEDYRIDFEDGYGIRSDEEEDKDAAAAADETVQAMSKGLLPKYFGIRVKPFSHTGKERSRRTLEIFLSRLNQQSSGTLPGNFVVNLPKVRNAEDVAWCTQLIQALEQRFVFPPGSIGLELMVEMPAVISGDAGQNALRALHAASEGRCRAMHLGLYDFLSSLDVVSSQQEYVHPLTDHLRSVTKSALAGTDIRISDGATNTIPVGPNKGEHLTPAQRKANRTVVHAGWAKVFAHVTHSLRMGIYQGWDLHPSQFPPRYAAVFALFLRERDGAVVRMRAFLERAAQATVRGQQFDDIATGQGLLHFFQRGVACAALNEEEVKSAGLTIELLQSKSFAEIVTATRREHSQ